MFIELTIDRFENEKAILKTEDSEIIVWPKNKLPKDSNEGSVIAFNISNSNDKKSNNKQLAKDILNEILNTDSN
ncbi:DUF3006 domain-containing protein [bacterium]|nr:DUF3006 domain-containing protein [bacterium]